MLLSVSLSFGSCSSFTSSVSRVAMLSVASVRNSFNRSSMVRLPQEGLVGLHAQQAIGVEGDEQAVAVAEHAIDHVRPNSIEGAGARFAQLGGDVHHVAHFIDQQRVELVAAFDG